MSEENTNIEETVETVNSEETVSSHEESKSESMDETIAKLVEQRVNEQLKDIKGKLDSAYEARDEAVREKAKLEEAKKKEQIEKLEEEGKHKEVYELKMADLQGRLEAREAQITELTRNAAVREAITGFDFRNDSAQKMAYTEILAELIQDENGAWIHKSGLPIKEFAEVYRKDDEKSFLFKPKQSSGLSAGTPADALQQGDASKLSKPMSQMTQEEIVAAMRAGAFSKDGDGSLF